MAQFEQREGGMSIFKNQYKEREGQPDYTGTAKIDGKDKQVSCWLKQTTKGDNYFSCQVQEKYIKPSSEGQPNPNYNPNAAINNDFDDDIPF